MNYATQLLIICPLVFLAGFIDSFANFRKLPKNTVIKGGGEFETKE